MNSKLAGIFLLLVFAGLVSSCGGSSSSNTATVAPNDGTGAGGTVTDGTGTDGTGTDGTGTDGTGTDGTGTDGTGTDGTGTPIEQNVPQIILGSCGVSDIQQLTASTDVDFPGLLASGQIARATVDSEGVNSAHYWDFQVNAGFYHLIVDSELPSGSISNIGAQVNLLNDFGEEAQQVIRSNEIHPRIRDYSFIEVFIDGNLRVKVEPVFNTINYQIGLFPNGSSVPSPFLVNCPEIRQIAVDTKEAFSLGSRPASQWFKIDLGVGTYSLTVDASRSSGQSGNIIYQVFLYEGFGAQQSELRLTRANSIGVSDREVDFFTTSEAGTFFILVESTVGNYDMEFSFQRQ